MSFYNSGIKTHLIDPVFNRDNFQSEFRLNDNTVYLSNWRLANVGIKATAGGKFNALVGTYGVIKSIHLYDDNQLLDQILEAQIWQAFLGYNQNNNNERDLNRYLARNGMGFTFDHNKQIDVYLPTFGPNVNGPRNSTDPSPSGWLNLKTLFPFLDSSMYVPSNVFTRLRLVVQYDKDIYLGTSVPDKTTEPLLIVDELVNDSVKSNVMKNYKGVTYDCIEHDRVVLDAIPGNDTEQERTFNVNGFNNKTLHRLLIVNTPTQTPAPRADETAFSQVYGNLGSAAQHNEEIMVRVNGSNKLPRDGLTRPNQRLAMLTDTWGTCNAYPGSNVTWLYNSANTDANQANDNAGVVLNPLDRIGHLDYCGLMVNEYINELEVTFKRKSLTNNITKQQLLLNLFGQVRKSVVMKGGSGGQRYNVMYV